MDNLRKAASVGKSRLWCFAAMDGDPFLRAYALTQVDPQYMDVAMLASLGHESWNHTETLLSLLHPFLGEFLLCKHAGCTPSIAFQRMLEHNTDKHKTREWLDDVLLEAMEKDMLSWYFLDTDTNPRESPPSFSNKIESAEINGKQQVCLATQV
jgi:hypothetical protein